MTIYNYSADPPLTDDDPEADYIAYVAAQESELSAALTTAASAVHAAISALRELTELDAPQWTQTTEGDDAQAALTEAARVLRTANRCVQAATWTP